jgi:hypothetical protein
MVKYPGQAFFSQFSPMARVLLILGRAHTKFTYALSRSHDGCKARSAANGTTIRKLRNAADACDLDNPAGR